LFIIIILTHLREYLYEFDKIIKQGYLEKQGAFIQNWKKRFFVLKKGSLFYYGRPEDKYPKGIISLMKASVVPFVEFKKEKPTNTFCSELEAGLGFVVKTGRRNFIIKAPDALERDDWYVCLSYCITIDHDI
jgi:hypothetical protein